MISQVIEQILAEDERSRSSDKHLILKVWSHYGFHLTEAQRYKFFELPSAETIRRVRQKTQEQGKYPAKDSVQKERRFKSYRMTQIAPKATPKYIENTLI